MKPDVIIVVSYHTQYKVSGILQQVCRMDLTRKVENNRNEHITICIKCINETKKQSAIQMHKSHYKESEFIFLLLLKVPEITNKHNKTQQNELLFASCSCQSILEM